MSDNVQICVTQPTNQVCIQVSERGMAGQDGQNGTPGVGIDWIGEWSPSTAYVDLDGVGYLGSSWIANQMTDAGDEPGVSPKWDLWVAKGEVGTAGAPGQDGQDGAPGLQGPKGDTGATGATGDPGPSGPKGDTGSVGPAGEQGIQGNPGQDGAPGEKGDTGDTGPAGPKGDTGLQGEQGPAGVDAVLPLGDPINLTGTEMQVGYSYYKSFPNGATTLTINGAPANGDTILVRVDVASGTAAVTFPSCYRSGTATGLAAHVVSFPAGNYTAVLTYAGSDWWLNDDGED